MKRPLIIVFLLITIQAFASHIVGGEFQLVHLTDYKYRIDLIIYFDEINGLPGNKIQDQIITAKIFKNADGSFVRDVALPLYSDTPVEYTQKKCAIGLLSTSKMFYSTEVTLEPETYNDPGGYYIVWERCCRNYSITNIVSKNPTDFPGEGAGQTFFLQFPPVIKSGVPFINSSPQLLYPFSDYACINRLFYSDFSGIDADGDSLVYSITTPWSTHSVQAYPPINPKPYPEVTWRPSFSLQNVMRGNPDLSISKQGMITVKPTNLAGLFALAVTCEEYRDGVKIGEVRRDYQLLVEDCDEDVAPVISAGMHGTYTRDTLGISFDNTVSDSLRCINVRVSDADIFKPAGFEKVRISAIAIGFNGDVSGFLPAEQTATLTMKDQYADFKIGFDKCPPVQSGIFQIGIIAYDDACSVPLTDTVHVNISIQKPIEGCKHEQVITFPSIPNKTHGDEPFLLTASASSGLMVTYVSADTTIATVTSATLTIHKPGTAIIKATQSGNESYKTAPEVERQFCINPTPPVLSVENTNAAIAIVSNSETGNQWFKDGVLLEGVTGKILEVTDVAHYTAKATAGSCISELSNGIFILGMDDQSEKEFEIFPNPASKLITIHISGNKTNNRVSLLDINGRALTQQEIFGKTAVINIESFKEGTYFLKIQRGSEIYLRKVLKN
jgi:hypothetical protein